MSLLFTLGDNRGLDILRILRFVMKAVNIPPDILITTKYVFLYPKCSSKSADGTDFLRFLIFMFSV